MRTLVAGGGVTLVFLLFHIELKFESAILDLPDIPPPLVPAASLLALTENHARAVDVERATPEGVDCLIDIDHGKLSPIATIGTNRAATLLIL